VGVSAAATLAVGLPATAAADSAGALPADWVAYDIAPAGATVQTTVGTSDGQSGCVFSFSGSLAPGQTAERADEIGYSPSTCQSQIAYTSGASAAPEAAQPSNADTAGSGSVASTDTDTAPPPATSAAVRHSAGYMKSWYRDPVHLTVNSVQNSTNWHWNGGCVVAPVSGAHTYTWFSGSGWSLQANNWQNNYSCAQSTSSSYAHFHNGIFCLTIDTDTYYNRNNVHGKANGVLTGNVKARKSGGCTGLLSFHWSLKRTLN